MLINKTIFATIGITKNLLQNFIQRTGLFNLPPLFYFDVNLPFSIGFD